MKLAMATRFEKKLAYISTISTNAHQTIVIPIADN